MPRIHQRQEQRLDTRLLHIRLSDLLEMGEKDYQRWVAGLERDPLYALLRRPPEGGAAVRRQAWGQTRWQAPEAAAEAVAPAEGALPSDAMAALIRRIGREDFERCFLYNDAMGDAEAAEACGLTLEQARAINDYLDGAMAAGGPALPAGAAPAGPAVDVVAAFEKGKDGFEVAFYSAHHARGVYRIDYDAVERLKRSGAVAMADWRKLADLLGRLETANARQTVLTGVLRFALKRQAKFLESGDPLDLAAVSQKEAAEELGVSPSSVSRAIAGRAVRLPWGGERPVEDLFPSSRDVAVEWVRAELAREPGLKDGELRRRLSGERGIKVTVRAVNLYRRRASA